MIPHPRATGLSNQWHASALADERITVSFEVSVSELCIRDGHFRWMVGIGTMTDAAQFVDLDDGTLLATQASYNFNVSLLSVNCAYGRSISCFLLTPFADACR